MQGFEQRHTQFDVTGTTSNLADCPKIPLSALVEQATRYASRRCIELFDLGHSPVNPVPAKPWEADEILELAPTVFNK